ncbi:hypothetical protein CCMA1212_004341, partial [Trichoderma ghanense]
YQARHQQLPNRTQNSRQVRIQQLSSTADPDREPKRQAQGSNTSKDKGRKSTAVLAFSFTPKEMEPNSATHDLSSLFRSFPHSSVDAALCGLCESNRRAAKAVPRQGLRGWDAGSWLPRKEPGMPDRRILCSRQVRLPHICRYLGGDCRASSASERKCGMWQH